MTTATNNKNSNPQHVPGHYDWCECGDVAFRDYDPEEVKIVELDLTTIHSLVEINGGLYVQTSGDNCFQPVTAPKELFALAGGGWEFGGYMAARHIAAGVKQWFGPTEPVGYEPLHFPNQSGNYGAVPATWYSLVKYQGHLYEMEEQAGPHERTYYIIPYYGSVAQYISDHEK